MMMMMIIFLKSEGQYLNKAVPGGLALDINTALCRKVKAIYFCLLNRGGHIAIRSVEEKRGDIINILVKWDVEIGCFLSLKWHRLLLTCERHTQQS